jgi:hypothetical protein
VPTIKNVGGKIRYSVERFDGGLNTKDAPSKTGAYETPECLNVVFDDAGAVATRDGTAQFNTTAIGSFAIDGGISYNQTMIVWANGNMYRASGPSGTTFSIITQSSGKFTAGSKIAAKVYQNILFCSDGTNGPYKYTGSENFYNMGIDIPSAPTGASTGAGSISTGTYYYAVSFVNSQAVEGEYGSFSAAVTLTGSSTVGLTQIPVGSTLAGVNARNIYRAETTSGPWRKVGTISDNTTTTFNDTTANGAEGKFAVEDGTKPTPFSTIELHKERLFFRDSSNTSYLRYTNFTNPFISEVENFEPIDQGDGEAIIAIVSQDDFVTAFKENSNTAIETSDPSNDLTWVKRKSPSNLGIVGPRAFAYMQNGVVFMGKQNNRLTGLHVLSGLQVVETFDGRLRSQNISEKIEYDLLTQVESSKWADIAMAVYKNRLHIAYPFVTTTSGNDRIFWLDLNRFVPPNQPGSWAPWSGIKVSNLFVHNGLLFGGSSQADGKIIQFERGSYADQSSAINSYFWTKEIGGQEEGELDSYIKDLREVYVWVGLLGTYNMNVRYRTDGDSGNGVAFPVDLTPTGSLWGTMVWGGGVWGGTRTDFEKRLSIGRVQGRRFQFRFDNQNTVNQGFKAYRLEVGMNLRRRR